MKLSVFKVLLFQMKHSQTSFVVRNGNFLKLPNVKGKYFVWNQRTFIETGIRSLEERTPKRNLQFLSPCSVSTCPQVPASLGASLLALQTSLLFPSYSKPRLGLTSFPHARSGLWLVLSK